MQNPPFKSDIFYSVQNEDYATELAVLRRIDVGRPQRVLMVASSGENALSILTQDTIASVDAVDINPAQLHLCELRRTAAEQLGRDEQLRLLGSDPSMAGEVGAAERLDLYERLRPYLPEPTRAFWDARRDHEIAFGVHHVGRNDVGMHIIQENLRRAGFDLGQQHLTDDDLPAWKKVYAETLNPDYVRDLFGLPSEGLAAKIAGISSALGECHFNALRLPASDHNPFVTTSLLNRYPASEDGLPLYLQLSGQESLLQLGTQTRLHLHLGSIVEYMMTLSQQQGQFDIISISNIADWMTEQQFGALVEQARPCLLPDGALLARSANANPVIFDTMRRQMDMDDSFNVALTEVERGPWFRTIASGFVRS